MIDSVKFYGTATIGTKGQIVIPAEAREELKLKEGDKLIVVKSPQSGGLSLIQADALEAMIQKMQSHSNKLLEAVENIKNITDK